MLKNNTSGVRGVTWAAARQKWMAQIVFQRQRFHLGYYDKRKMPSLRAKMAEEAIFGNFLEWFKQRVSGALGRY
ncbi:MAG: hypothetical protein ACLR6B_03080 [Blautia sp.]